MISLKEYDEKYIVVDNDNVNTYKISQLLKDILTFEIEALEFDIFKYNDNEKALKDMILHEEYSNIINGVGDKVKHEYVKQFIFDNEDYKVVKNKQQAIVDEILKPYVDVITTGDGITLQVYKVCNTSQIKEIEKALGEDPFVNHHIKEITKNYYKISHTENQKGNISDLFLIAKILGMYGEKQFINPVTLEKQGYTEYVNQLNN